MENLEKVKNSLFNSVGLKLALIAFLSLLLLIPAFMIMNLIREREQRSNETINEVTSLWGNEQTLTAPVLTLQVVTFPKAGENTTGTTTRYVHFLPENLKIYRECRTGGKTQGDLQCGHLPVKTSCNR